MPSILTKHFYLECGGTAPLSEGRRSRKAWSTAATAPFIALPLLAFYPVATWYFARITDGSDEPYGIIALLLAAYFIFRDRAKLRPTPLGWGLAALATAIYALAYPDIPPMFRGLLAIVALTAATGIIRANPGATALLVLSLPLVASLQFYAGYPLRVLVASSTSGALNLIGFDVTREGTMLDWEGHLVGVDAPCSGVKMLWAACALAACFAAAASLRFLRSAALIALSVALVILANIARGFLLFFKESGAVPLPEWTHAAIGILCFAAFALILSRLANGVTPAISR